MINDHRPYFVKQTSRLFEQWYCRHFVAPQLAALGPGHHFMKPWNIKIYGSDITIGDNAHIVTANDRQVSLATWHHENFQGHINIGNQCLICPGVRLDSASSIVVGDNCMIAAGSYLTDADWHDIYDRTKPVGNTQPVVLGENVWIGDGATICKGVTIGDNSIIGASSVVVGDIEANSIAVGNPAKIVRQLDTDRPMVTRADLFEKPEELAYFIDQVDRHVLRHNHILGWIRSLIMPKRGD